MMCIIKWFFWLPLVVARILPKESEPEYITDCCLFASLGIVVIAMSAFLGRWLNVELVISSFALSERPLSLIVGTSTYLTLGMIAHRSLKLRWERGII